MIARRTFLQLIVKRRWKIPHLKRRHLSSSLREHSLHALYLLLHAIANWQHSILLTIVLTTVKPCQRIHHLGSRAPLLGGGAGGQPDPQFMEILTKQPPHGTDALADTLAQVVEAPAAQIPFG